MLKIVNLCVTDKEKKKFLFLKRIKKPYAGYWGVLGGKIEKDEEPSAASRELREESGINALGELIGKCHEQIFENNEIIAEFEIYMYHFVAPEEDSILNFDSHEGELKWFSLDEFKKTKLIPSDPLMIKTFFDKGYREVESVILKKGDEYYQEKFEESIVEKVRGFVKEVCDNLEHGDEWFNNHFSSVVKYSKMLAEKNNADVEVVEIAAWLHDMGSITLGRDNHHLTGSEIAEKKLREFGYPNEKIERVKHCILAHRGSQNIKRETIEAQILADADSMSHFDELAGLFKYQFIIGGINFKQREAQKNVKEKLERSYSKLSDSAKKLIKPKYDAAMLLLNGGNDNITYLENKKPLVGVGVMILKDGKVLLGKRHEDKEKATGLKEVGSWTMPGGKLEYGETFEECGIRETIEECGIDLNKLKLICINNNKNEHAHFVTIGLFCDDFFGEAKVMEPDKITEWKWFSLDNLPIPLFSPSAKVIESYKSNKIYLRGKE